MGLQPNIKKKRSFQLRECPVCHNTYGPDGFAPTNSIFYPDGVIPICNSCLKEWLTEQEFSWDAVDRICQYAGIPFIPKEWERLRELNGDNAFPKYAEVFLSSEYEGLGWKEYYEEFKKIKEAGCIEEELPGLDEEKRKKQRKRWGANYDDEALDYLDSLFDGLMSTQNVNGNLQIDQARKICKMSYEIDCRIREGSDFDKLLSSYDKLIKAAEFTPKNVKNINDFDTAGEMVKWMEKNGWKNRFYDRVTRDVVDETMKNLENFNQRLYTNESGIGDEITRRIEALKTAKEIENYYDVNKEYDLDKYDDDGYAALMLDQDDDFEVDLGGELNV